MSARGQGGPASGLVAWITGLPASGKTTLAERARQALGRAGRAAVVLDSDRVRELIAPELGYRPDERAEFYRRLAALAAHLADQGLVVLVAATAPERAHRERARRDAPRFLEILVDTPAEECARRDPKGLYRRAAAGAAPDLPGPGARYERPERPDLVASGGRDDDAVARLVELALG